MVFAVSTALLLGGSDFFAARSARSTPSITVTRTAVSASVVLSPLLLLLVDSHWVLRDVGIGLLLVHVLVAGSYMSLRPVTRVPFPFSSGSSPPMT